MVDPLGHVTSVVLTPDLWRRMIVLLEEAEDRSLREELAPRLALGPTAGEESALRWSEVASEWE